MFTGVSLQIKIDSQVNIQVFVDKQKDVIYIKKLNLIRFAHHWNVGTMEYWALAAGL